MEFEWDEEKRQQNIQERNVDILYAALIFENPVLTKIDDREDYGEERIIALGHVSGEYFTLVYTPRGDKIRLITAWKAGNNGEKEYKNRILEGAEKDAGPG